MYSDTILLICCVLTACLCEYTHNFIHCTSILLLAAYKVRS